eukprot:3248222-Rhodomonas_salina.5
MTSVVVDGRLGKGTGHVDGREMRAARVRELTTDCVSWGPGFIDHTGSRTGICMTSTLGSSGSSARSPQCSTRKTSHSFQLFAISTTPPSASRLSTCKIHALTMRCDVRGRDQI